MKAKIEWKNIRGQSFYGGKVEERYYCRRIYEDGHQQHGYMVRLIWWENGRKCVEHYFKWEGEQ